MTLLEKINEVVEQNRGSYGGNPEDVPDWLVADVINAKSSETQSAYKNIICNEIKSILILSGEFAVMKSLSTQGVQPVNLLCLNIIEALDCFEYIDLNISEYYEGWNNILTNLIAAGLISALTQDQINALVITEDIVVYGQSWAEQNEVFVDSRTVGLLRGGIA